MQKGVQEKAGAFQEARCGDTRPSQRESTGSESTRTPFARPLPPTTNALGPWPLALWGHATRGALCVDAAGHRLSRVPLVLAGLASHCPHQQRPPPPILEGAPARPSSPTTALLLIYPLYAYTASPHRRSSFPPPRCIRKCSSTAAAAAAASSSSSLCSSAAAQQQRTAAAPATVGATWPQATTRPLQQQQ